MRANCYIFLAFVMLIGELLLPIRAFATTFWIDASRGASAGCGKTADTACPGYANLMGGVGCPAACGCDSNGCLNEINADSGKVTIAFVSGTYHGDGNGHCIGIGFDRGPDREVTLRCTDQNGAYAPQTCTVDAVGISIPAQFGTIAFRGDPVTCSYDTATSYVALEGFRSVLPLPGESAIRIRGNVHHYALRDNVADCDGVDGSCVISGPATDFGTYVNNTIRNCGNGAFGCLGHQEADNLAIVGNVLGPNWHGYQPTPANNDVITVQNGRRVLIDGNVVQGPQTNCIDIGQLSVPGHPLSGNIVRYNDAFDCGNVRGSGDWTSNVIKVSGDAGLAQASTDNILYKNVVRFTSTANRNGGIWLTELTKDTDLWYNTVWGVEHDVGDGTRSTITVSSSAGAGNMPVLFNLLDSDDSTGCMGGQACPLIVGGASGCMAADCKWVGNGWWFGGLDPSVGLITFSGIDVASANYSTELLRMGGGAEFNATGANEGNFRAEPHLVKPAGATLGDYRLTEASISYLDKGDGFCHTTGAGTGTTVSVICAGASEDPRHYFPQPSDYYALHNDDCKGRGTRAQEANGTTIGCFDLQIEGECGVRTIRSLGPTSIRIEGGSCAWEQGARVHVPWHGSAPDLGALEYGPIQSTDEGETAPGESGEPQDPFVSAEVRAGCGCNTVPSRRGPSTLGLLMLALQVLSARRAFPRTSRRRH